MSLVPAFHRAIAENLELKQRVTQAEAEDQLHLRNTAEFIDRILAAGTPAPDTGSARQMRQFAASARALLTSPASPIKLSELL